MRKREKLPELSRPEFDILRILWKEGPLSVRELHDQLVLTYSWAYSTTKTTMDRMAKKKLLVRESFHGVFIYKPLLSRPRGFAKFIKFFADRVFELDYAPVVSLFAQSNALTPEEVDELSRLLDQEDRKEQNQ